MNTTINPLGNWTETDVALYVLECEVAYVKRDFLPTAPPRAYTMSIADAERITGITLEAATAIIETEGTIIP